MASLLSALYYGWTGREGDEEEIIMLSQGSVLSAGVESLDLTPVIINQEIATLTTDFSNILELIKDHEVT